jgi:hypothetical protein
MFTVTPGGIMMEKAEKSSVNTQKWSMSMTQLRASTTRGPNMMTEPVPTIVSTMMHGSTEQVSMEIKPTIGKYGLECGEYKWR